jgi:hypothetical protein
MQLFYASPTTSPHRVGELFTLYAVTNDANEIFRNVSRQATWSSSDPAVVQVGSGVVRAVGNGLAQVAATYEGMTAFLLIRVSPPPSFPYLLLTNTIYVPYLGSSGTVRARLVTGDGIASTDVTALATWTSSDPQVATVAQGTITALRLGTVEITASYGGAVGVLRLSVQPTGCC